MDSSLYELWQSPSATPFLPTIGKNTQFLVGFVLLLLGLSLTGAFALSVSPVMHYMLRESPEYLTNT